MSNVLHFPRPVVQRSPTLAEIVGAEMAADLVSDGSSDDEAIADLVVELLDAMTPDARQRLVAGLPLVCSS